MDTTELFQPSRLRRESSPSTPDSMYNSEDSDTFRTGFPENNVFRRTPHAGARVSLNGRVNGLTELIQRLKQDFIALGDASGANYHGAT